MRTYSAPRGRQQDQNEAKKRIGTLIVFERQFKGMPSKQPEPFEPQQLGEQRERWLSYREVCSYGAKPHAW